MAYRQVSLDDLRDRVKQKIDIQGSGNRFVDPTELDAVIGRAIGQSHVTFVNVNEDWTLKRLTVNLTGSMYQLPDDWWAVRGVDLVQSDGSVIPIRDSGFQTRGMSSVGFGDSYGYSYTGLSYFVQNSGDDNDVMFFQPPTSTPGNIRLTYVPTVPELVSSGSLLPRYMTNNGWDELVVVEAAIYIKQKKDEDPSDLIRERDELKFQMITMAKRDKTGLKQVELIRTANDDWLFNSDYPTMRGGY